MEFRVINDKEFLALVVLNSLMYEEINSDINGYQATNTLMFFINQKAKFVALGLYNGDDLVGFVHGHEMTLGIFLYTGIYVLPTYRKHVNELVEYSFNYVEKLGYKRWEADATNDNIASILKKHGAKIVHTRYGKDFN